MAQSSFTTLNDLVFPFKKYVLALPGWYPTWIDPHPGDFNQRHIIAASQYTPQIVLYIAKDPSGTLKKTETRYNQLTKNVIEICVLYPGKTNAYVKGIHSQLEFLRLLNKYTSFIKRRWGPPVLLHSYIVIKGGLSGLLLSKKWKIPFVLTENWTVYYPEDPGYLKRRNWLFRWTVKQVFSRVNHFLPVTNDLDKRVSRLFKTLNSTVIPNVVETETFYYDAAAKKKKEFSFIHVSTMIYQKNPEGLLRSFKAYNKVYPQSSLVMVGPYSNELKEYAAELELSGDVIRFTGTVPYNKVAELIFNSDALVLFSRYENLPCVILEALCCGKPVISTNVGGIAEVIDNDNGVLVASEDEGSLLNALIAVSTNIEHYDKAKVAELASGKFSYTSVGKQIDEVYSTMIKRD